MDIIYKYDKNSLISFYDNSFDKKLFFEYEIDISNKDYKLSNYNRKIILKDNLKEVIYLNDNNIEQIKDGILYSNNVGKVMLIPVGENIYLLSYYDGPIYNVRSLLYSYMSDYECVIDVSKFYNIFKEEFTILDMYKYIGKVTTIPSHKVIK